jgi:beta-mannosidase
MEKQVRQLFGKMPESMEDFVFASQVSQAEAKKFFIENVRVHRETKKGIIWWNLLDGWPQMSDAVVDYYFEKKLAYSYIKRSQAKFSIIADEIECWQLPIYACNDTLNTRRGRLKITDTSDGSVIYECDFCAAPNTSTLIAKLPVYYSDRKILIFEWEADGERGFNHYLCANPPISLEDYRAVMEKYGL